MECRLETIEAITKFIFVSDKPQKADIIIVPGSSHPQLPMKAVRLYKAGYGGKIIFTGGFNAKMSQNDCDFGRAIALEEGVPEKDIFVESLSTNTKENAYEAKKLIENNGLRAMKVLLVSKPYHARRLKMTFTKLFPATMFLIIPVMDNTKISQNNWWKDKEKSLRVMDEVRRIGEYYQKGDLSI